MPDILSVRDCDRAIPPQQDRLGLWGSEASDYGLTSSIHCRCLTGQEQNQISVLAVCILENHVLISAALKIKSEEKHLPTKIKEENQLGVGMETKMP